MHLKLRTALYDNAFYRMRTIVQCVHKIGGMRYLKVTQVVRWTFRAFTLSRTKFIAIFFFSILAES